MNEQEKATLQGLLGPGWYITGRTPVTETVDVPDTMPSGKPDPSGGTHKVTQQTPNTWDWSISDGKGHNRTMRAALTKDGNGNDTYNVVKPPEDLPASQTPSTTPTVISAPANEKNVVVRDPTTGGLSSVANPAYDPSTAPDKTVTVGNAIYQQAKDASGNISYTKVFEAPSPPKMISGGSANDQYNVFQDPQYPNDPTKTVQVPNANYVPPKPDKPTVVQGKDGAIYSVSPDGTKITNLVEGQAPPQIVTGKDGAIYSVASDGTLTQQQAAPKTPPSVVSTNTASPTITTIDSDGTIHSQPNPGYVPSTTTLNPNTTAASIPIATQGADGKVTVQWVPNQNQQTVSQAVLGLYDSLKGVLGNGQGQIPLDQAQALLTAARDKLALDQTAAANAESARHNQATEAQSAQAEQDTAEANRRTYAQGIAQAAGDYQKNMMQYVAPPGTEQDLNSLYSAFQNGTTAQGLQARTFKIPNPATYIQNVAAQVLAGISPAAQQHLQSQGLPVPPPQTGYTPPQAPPQPAAPFMPPNDQGDTGQVTGAPGVPVNPITSGGPAFGLRLNASQLPANAGSVNTAFAGPSAPLVGLPDTPQPGQGWEGYTAPAAPRLQYA